MEKIIVYTDGGCSGNPGPGGWAYVILDKEEKIKCSGGDKNTTNNKMELTAVIMALKGILNSDKYSGRKPVIHTDSTYVKQGITTWIHNWVRNGWKTANKQPVKNKELWQELKILDDEIRSEWKWVKGHAGNELNELCDSLVRDEMDKITGNATKKKESKGFSLNNKKFRSIENAENGETSDNTVFHYFQDKNIIWADYSGGSIIKGHLIGLIDKNKNLDFRYHHINDKKEIMTGKCKSKPDITDEGIIRYIEKWQWTCGDRSTGTSVIEEIK
jgi:ribonuclease HI